MDLTGKTVGKYKLTERLGSGGMAEVYKAFQSGVERDVAIKVMHTHLADDEDFRERFQREARAVGQLQHPNIMRVIDFDAADGDYYMVLEYLSGGTLRDYIVEGEQLPVPESLAIIRQLCDALSYAHERGMIHRDIKPGNIMFNDSTHSRAILTDFGMARLMNEAKLTVSGAMLGTPAYMPPEVVKGEAVDHRADFYSLGAVLYEMITGRTPHVADTSYAVLIKQVNDPLPLPSEFLPDIDPALEMFLLKALAKEPIDRFANAQEMLAALDIVEGKNAATLTGATILKQPTQATVFTQPNQQKTDNNNKWLMIGGAMLGVVVLGLLAMMLLNRGLQDGTAEFEPTAVSEIGSTAVDTAVVQTPSAPTTESAIVPTEANEAELVTAVPTEDTIEEPTAAPTAAPAELNSEIDIAQQAISIADIQFRDSNGQAANTFSLSLARIPQPDEGTEHIVWLVGDAGAQALGVLPVEGNRSEFTGPIQGNAITDFNRFVISMEPIGSPRNEVTGAIAYEKQLSDDFLNPMRTLLNDNLVNNNAQLAIAQQHLGFLQDELASGNLNGARTHAEHVINILDGADGANFGDLDGDGSAQNPGDDVGVRVYLESALASANAAQEASITTPFTQTSSDKTVLSLENSLAILAEAQNNLLKLFAVDTAVEGQPIADQMTILLQQVQNGSDNDGNGVVDALAGEGGVTAVYENGLRWLAHSYVAENGFNSATNSPLGTVHFAPDSLTLTVNNVLLPPAEMTYHAWLVGEGGTTPLGPLSAENNQIRALLPANEQAFQQNSQLLITLENESVGSEPSDTAVYSASLPPETQAMMVALLAINSGLISNLTAQTQLAVDHAGFMIDELTVGNLAGGKIHAEHVINILVGEAGAEFGDLDGNGRAENPGDGIGVRAYLQQIAEQIATIEHDSTERQFYAALTTATIANSLSILDEIVNNISKVLAADTAAEAIITSEEIRPQADQLQLGIDKDQNGVVDPLRSEGGIQTLRSLLTALAHWVVATQ